MPEPMPPKKIVFLQADRRSKGVRAEILGSNQSLNIDEEFTLVVYGLIARFYPRDNAGSRIGSLPSQNPFEVRPGRPLTLKAKENILRLDSLLRGENPAFDLELIPLMDRTYSCT